MKLPPKTRTEDSDAHFYSELNIMHELETHPNIVKYAFMQSPYLAYADRFEGQCSKVAPQMLVYEHCAKGTLLDYLRRVRCQDMVTIDNSSYWADPTHAAA